MAAEELKQAIQKAIDDHVVTSKEFEEIMNIAEADGRIDKDERALLRTLHNMIIDKTVTWEKGR